MSREIGREIPSYLLESIRSETPPLTALPIIGVDQAGFPHAAMISYFELLLLEDQLFCFLNSGSRTAGMLKSRRQGTLLVIETSRVLYLKFSVRSATHILESIVFRIEPESILEDSSAESEKTARLVSTMKFTSSSAEMLERLNYRSRLKANLRSTL